MGNEFAVAAFMFNMVEMPVGHYGGRATASSSASVRRSCAGRSDGVAAALTLRFEGGYA